MHRSAAAFGRVHDLEVLDVDRTLAKHGGDPRERAWFVGDLDLPHRDAGPDRRLGRQTEPSLFRRLERRPPPGPAACPPTRPEPVSPPRTSTPPLPRPRPRSGRGATPTAR